MKWFFFLWNTHIRIHLEWFCGIEWRLRNTETCHDCAGKRKCAARFHLEDDAMDTHYHHATIWSEKWTFINTDNISKAWNGRNKLRFHNFVQWDDLASVQMKNCWIVSSCSHQEDIGKEGGDKKIKLCFYKVINWLGEVGERGIVIPNFKWIKRMQFLCEDNQRIWKKFGPSNDFENLQQFKIDILMHVSFIIITFIFNQGTIYTEELCIYKWR